MKSVAAYGDTKSPRWHLVAAGLFLSCFDPVLNYRAFENDKGLRLFLLFRPLSTNSL